MSDVRPADAKSFADESSTAQQPIHLQLESLAKLLDRCRQQRETLTYIEVADALDVAPPQRIHKVTLLLEALMEHDCKQSQPLHTALVVSRNRTGLPAKGFFLKARALGLTQSGNDQEFHKQCLNLLFSS